jgi:hypothetical protein
VRIGRSETAPRTTSSPPGRIGSSGPSATCPGAERCRRKFLKAFPGGFRDATYLDWERDYKVEAHQRWMNALAEERFRELLSQGRHEDIAATAVRVEQQARHSMLFSFEKMALRDAVRTRPGARAFSEGLFQFLHGGAELAERFGRWVAAVESLPRRQTRVLTWPLVTVFGFLAQPDAHFFLKPNVTKIAARKYGYPFRYESRPSWDVYSDMLEFARVVRRDLRDLKPRDMIDIQSFLWVQGSDEYA